MDWKHRLQRQFEAEFDQIVSSLRSGNTDSKIEKACTMYLCIRLTGLLEQFHKEMIINLADGRCPKYVCDYIKASYPRSKGMKPDNCLAFWDSTIAETGQLLRMNPEFEAEGKWHAAIKSCYSVRDSQAHGGMMSVGLELLKLHKKHIFEYMDFVSQCAQDRLGSR